MKWYAPMVRAFSSATGYCDVTMWYSAWMYCRCTSASSRSVAASR